MVNDDLELMPQLIELLLHADDVVLFPYYVANMQCILRVVETFCQSSRLTMNIKKKMDASVSHPTTLIPTLI